MNGLLINGELVQTSLQLDVINPATEQVFTTVPRANEEQLNQAVAAAKIASKLWAKTENETRQKLLISIADCMHENIEELAKIITQEQGKPLEAATLEIHWSEAFCRYFASQQVLPEVLEEDDTKRIEIHHKPLGVVGAIIPWNLPFLIIIYKLAPALLTGNSIIIKPSPTTPVVAVKFGELLKDIVPKGLVNIIVDNNDLGPLLTAHADVNKISFTGSTPTGKAIMASAASTLKPITLELGGNDAGIVLDDVNPQNIAAGIFGSAFINSGQVCIALKRLYVHELVYDDVCEEIAKLANAAVVGNGLDPTSQFGPVQNKIQFDKVCEYIADAKENGTIIAGGDVSDEPGYFVPLTVVKDIADGTKVVDEEPFGPILPIIKYSNIDDAIDSANSLTFGLGGSVWSSDINRARMVAQQLNCGTSWINQHCAFAPNIPFPATKESGIGVELGREGLLEYTNIQVVNINKVS